jgi:protoporphyrinogen oxidase
VRSATLQLGGSRYDIGAYRFFTLNDEMRRLFEDVGGHDIVRVKRLTRIYYRHKYFYYPLTPLNALFGMGLANSLGIIWSYFIARDALFKPKRKTIKALADEFMYPRLGAGMLYEKMKSRVEQGGGEVRLRTKVPILARWQADRWSRARTGRWRRARYDEG